MGRSPLSVPRSGAGAAIFPATIARAMAWPLLCGITMLKLLIRWCWKSLSVPEFLTVGRISATLGCRKVKAGGIRRMIFYMYRHIPFSFIGGNPLRSSTPKIQAIIRCVILIMTCIRYHKPGSSCWVWGGMLQFT